MALRISQGEGFNELVEAQVPLAMLVKNGHSQQDLQRAAKDWESTTELVADTLNKRRIAFTKLFRFLCEGLGARDSTGASLKKKKKKKKRETALVPQWPILPGEALGLCASGFWLHQNPG